jgi:hypothetical protein
MLQHWKVQRASKYHFFYYFTFPLSHWIPISLSLLNVSCHAQKAARLLLFFCCYTMWSSCDNIARGKQIETEDTALFTFISLKEKFYNLFELKQHSFLNTYIKYKSHLALLIVVVEEESVFILQLAKLWYMPMKICYLP